MVGEVIMHDPDQGHKCPSCSMLSICTIEDGFCENQGSCDTCRKQEIYDRMERRDRMDSYDGDWD
jgi:hypothetical protein